MSEVRKLWIGGTAGKLEAMLRVSPSPRGTAVVAHPHPMYGGTMHNPVVFHADRVLHRAGWTTLRFNFRGVGRSEGIHDEGRGEVDDVAAALSWTRGLAPDLPQMLVGYSFGAWCGYRHVLLEPVVDGFIAMGLAVKRYDFSDLVRVKVPMTVVQARHDEFGTPGEIEPLLHGAPHARMRVIEDTNHLFPRRAEDAAAVVLEEVDQILSTRDIERIQSSAS